MVASSIERLTVTETGYPGAENLRQRTEEDAVSVASLRVMNTGELLHQALFYRDGSSYLDATMAFVLDGLAAGEPVMVAVPGPQLTRVGNALGAAADHVRLIDMGELGRNPGRIIPMVRSFADAHSGPVRLIGESVWPERTDDEYPACARYEALVNAAFAGRPVTALCPYDVARLDARAVADAEATHPVIVDAAGPRESSRYAPEEAVARYHTPLKPHEDAETMAFDREGLSEARHAAVEWAAELGIAPDRFADVALAVGETCGNSVRHGGGSGVLAIWYSSGHLVCEVSDAGHITDPLAGCLPVPPQQAGGRGLLMVNQVADLVRIHSTPDGTAVRMWFRL